MERQVDDWLDFSRFRSIGLDRKTPDHSTIWCFREKIGKLGRHRKILDQINRKVENMSIIIKRNIDQRQSDESLMSAKRGGGASKRSPNRSRPDPRSLTDAIQDTFRETRIVKTFDMADAEVWSDPDMTFDGRPFVTLFTADTDDAADAIAALIRDVGNEPIRLGDNRHAGKLEIAAGIVIKFLFVGHPAHTVSNLVNQEAKTAA